LLNNEKYSRKVLPFLKTEYFEKKEQQVLFDEIYNFIDKYNNLPSREAIQIELEKRNDLNEETWKNAEKILNTLAVEDVDHGWLVDTTERYCKDRALHLAILQGIHIINGDDKNLNTDSLPDILSNALSVSFDNSVGHDYIHDATNRFEFYHKKEQRIPFDLSYFNKITNGGLPNKTLNICLAGTGVGKSLFMCHQAANCLLQGKNVLYITLEMAEERIAERIDANLMDLTIDELHELPKQMFDDAVGKIKKKTKGTLVVKEYPTATAHSGHFKGLLKELALKREFTPNIIFIDYINICASSRFKTGANVGSYFYIKAIAEEFRGLAVEHNLPIVSATQTTRSGFTATDIGLEDTSESFGLPATADFMFALIQNEQLEGLDQIMVKQLKNRYNDLTKNKKFVIGIDRPKMKLYDVEASAQEDLVDTGQDDTPSFDKANQLDTTDWKFN
jgi:replicative DNA helicase